MKIAMHTVLVCHSCIKLNFNKQFRLKFDPALTSFGDRRTLALLLFVRFV